MTARQPGGPEPGAGSHRQACLWSDTPRPPHCGGTWLSSSCPPPGGLSQQTRTHHRRTRGHGSGPQNSHLEQVPCTAVATERGGHTCRPTAPPPPGRRLPSGTGTRQRPPGRGVGPAACVGRGVRGLPSCLSSGHGVSTSLSVGRRGCHTHTRTDAIYPARGTRRPPGAFQTLDNSTQQKH